MKKILLIIITVVFLTGCGIDCEDRLKIDIEQCKNMNLKWKHAGNCQAICVTDFQYCTNQCEYLFREQASTWSNGSESQSKSAIDCMKLCLNT